MRNDDLENDVVNINSKYYTCDEFFNLNNNSSFNIFHSNVNGYLNKADNIHEFLSHDTDFDIICVSETSLTDGTDIPNSAKLAGFNDPFCTNTLSRNGGVAIFAKNSSTVYELILRYKTRNSREFGLNWIIIKAKIQ